MHYNMVHVMLSIIYYHMQLLLYVSIVIPSNKIVAIFTTDNNREKQ